jgi:N-acetylglutamate synthase
MQITADDLRRIERLHVRAWPAFETAEIDGWLWRYSGGGSQRANSVSTVAFSGRNPATAPAMRRCGCIPTI